MRAALDLRGGTPVPYSPLVSPVTMAGTVPAMSATRVNAATVCAAIQRRVASLLAAPCGVPRGVSPSTGAYTTTMVTR